MRNPRYDKDIMSYDDLSLSEKDRHDRITGQKGLTPVLIACSTEYANFSGFILAKDGDEFFYEEMSPLCMDRYRERQASLEGLDEKLEDLHQGYDVNAVFSKAFTVPDYSKIVRENFPVKSRKKISKEITRAIYSIVLAEQHRFWVFAPKFFSFGIVAWTDITSMAMLSSEEVIKISLPSLPASQGDTSLRYIVNANNKYIICEDDGRWVKYSACKFDTLDEAKKVITAVNLNCSGNKDCYENWVRQ